MASALLEELKTVTTVAKRSKYSMQWAVREQPWWWKRTLEEQGIGTPLVEAGERRRRRGAGEGRKGEGEAEGERGERGSRGLEQRKQ